MRKVPICLMIGVVIAFLASPVAAYKVPVYSVMDPNQDGLNLVPGMYDEGGDIPPFPVGEQIYSMWQYTDLTACTGQPYDDPGIPNVLVTITDINYARNPSQPLWYVADPETSLTNYDERVNGSLAFKIDGGPSGGINRPLIFESKIYNNLFDVGETWQFIIQDFINAFGGPPTPFNSLGIAAVSSGWPPSTGSIIPEPASLALLALGALAVIRRRR